MKKFFTFLMLIFIFFTGCSLKKDFKENNGKINVVTTIFPPYDFVRQIAGDNVNLSMVLPFGADVHSFEPTPKDIINILQADIFIYNGGESDVWVKRILDSADTSNMKILAISQAVDLLDQEIVPGMQVDEHDHDHEDEHDHDHEDEHNHDHEDDFYTEELKDEHVWTSIENAKKIAEKIGETLIQVDNRNKSIYEKNLDNYIKELDNLDNSLEQILKTSSRNTLVFADRFPFRYLAEDYGLDYYAAFPGCSHYTEASASTIGFLIDKVKEQNIPVVFNIEFSNEKISDVISESTGAKKLLLHSIHNISNQDFENGATYVSLMSQNIKNLKEALN